MTGVVAIALAAAFTSCSKSTDLYVEGAKEAAEAAKKTETVQTNYNEAFESVFGKPAENQDWGLAEYGTPKALSRAMTRSFTPTHLSSESSWTGWIAAPSSDDYKTEIPTTDIYPMNEYWRNTGTYYVQDPSSASDVIDIQPYNGNAIIYIGGTKNVKFTNPGDGAKNVIFYIIPGANIHFTTDFNYQKGSNKAMYVASGAKVTFDADMSSNVFIYNKGEIVVEGVCGPYADGAIYNDGGIITCKKSLNVFNNNSQIINNGTISVAEDVTIQGSGHFRNANDGVITVTGETIVNSNDCSWINDGDYTTGRYAYTAGSTDVINNCMLTVTGEFYMNLGDTDKNCFLMNGGAGVDAGSFHADGPGFIYMGSESVFKVRGNAKMDYTKADYGIYGPATGNSAVFHVLGNITTSNTAQGYDVTYGNNIAVVATDHFDSSTGYTSKSGAYPIVAFSNCTSDIIYTNGSLPSITIKEGKCNPGFTGDGNGGSKIEYTNRIFAEDLSADDDTDFDFNDVVFDWAISSDKKTAYIKLLAAGGTLPLKIGAAKGEGEEVHAKFEVSEKTMVNTGAGTTKNPVEFEITTTGEFKDASYIVVSVYKEGTWMTLTAPKGDASCKLYVPLGTKWVDEYCNINKAYPGFDAWVKTNASKPDWANPVTKYVDLDLTNND